MIYFSLVSSFYTLDLRMYEDPIFVRVNSHYRFLAYLANSFEGEVWIIRNKIQNCFFNI